MNSSPWRQSMVEMNNILWSPVLRYTTPLPMNRTPVSTVALQHKSVSSVLQYATPLPINRTPVSTVGGPFPPLCGTPGLISIASSVQALPMNTTTHSVLTHEHDDDVVSPFRPSHVHEPSPYVCASRRSRPHPYVHIRGRIFFLAPWPPLLRHVRASTSTSIYVRTRSRLE